MSNPKRKVTDLLPSEAILISSDADLKVLDEFEKIGAMWIGGIEKPTEWNPSRLFSYPYCIFYENDRISWSVRGINRYPAIDFIPTESDEVEVDRFDRALKLLKDLADLQNGAPIEQHRTEWEQTMDEVYTFLNQHEARNTLNHDRTETNTYIQRTY